ncbi:MAG: hypothetical protein RSC00_03265, partial [Ruthenibacterium sp.]
LFCLAQNKFCEKIQTQRVFKHALALHRQANTISIKPALETLSSVSKAGFVVSTAFYAAALDAYSIV